MRFHAFGRMACRLLCLVACFALSLALLYLLSVVRRIACFALSVFGSAVSLALLSLRFRWFGVLLSPPPLRRRPGG